MPDRGRVETAGRSEAGERQSPARRPIVPFERFFGVVGYALCSAVILLVLLELGSAAVMKILRRTHPDPVAPSLSPAYDGEPWAAEFWKEQGLMWQKARAEYTPFMVWGVRKWHGKYLNTDETEMGTWRRTIQARSPECPQAALRKVWVFGGSTVYGISSPDFGTIPSYLAREFNRDPQACVEVANLGAEAYVTNQEVILLMQQLKSGRRPDVAIFYDGVNDSILGGYSPRIPTAHWQYEAIKGRFEGASEAKLGFLAHSYSWAFARKLVNKFRGKDPAAYAGPSDDELAALARATLDNYQANLRIVRTLAAAYGFKVYFFWQPFLGYGDKPLGPFERELREAGNKTAGGEIQRGMAAVYREAERRSASSGDFVFLGRAFDAVREPLYSDGMHLAPRGNAIIARVLAGKVGPLSGAAPKP